MTMRAPNCTGTVRLGVEGSWSVTSSTSASTVKIQGVIQWPRKESQLSPRLSQPR